MNHRVLLSHKPELCVTLLPQDRPGQVHSGCIEHHHHDTSAMVHRKSIHLTIKSLAPIGGHEQQP